METLGTYQGTTQERTSEEGGSCGGTGAEAVYTLSIAGDSPLCLSTEGSNIDTVLYVRTDCGDSSSEVGCNDDYVGLDSSLTLDALGNVTYYVFVDSYGQSGEYTLDLSVGDCAPRNIPERCDLSGDEDQNGLADCDDPVCADSIECIGPISALACDSSVLIPIDAWGTYVGDSSNAPSGESGSCGNTTGREQVYAVTPPSEGLMCAQVTMASFDVTLYARLVCADPSSEVTCSEPDDTQITQVELSAESDVIYYFVIDSNESGTYQFSVDSGACPTE